MIILILITILALLVLSYIFYKPSSIKYYDYGNPNSLYKICLIAGVHGNEPAGVVALYKLVQSNYFNGKNAFIRVIPCVNEFGYKYNTRWCFDIFNPDINRAFGKNRNMISKNLAALINEFDFDIIIDFHEGWGYHLINNESIGSTISPNSGMISIAEKMAERVNKTIKKKEKKFVVIKDSECDIDNALACMCAKENKNYILVETTGQNDIQDMNTRCNQIIEIIKSSFL